MQNEGSIVAVILLFNFFNLLANLGSIPDVERSLGKSWQHSRQMKKAFYIWNTAKIHQEIEEVENHRLQSFHNFGDSSLVYSYMETFIARLLSYPLS